MKRYEEGVLASLTFICSLIIFLTASLGSIDRVNTAGIHDELSISSDGSLVENLGDGVYRKVDSAYLEVDLVSYGGKLYEKPSDLSVSYSENVVTRVEVFRSEFFDIKKYSEELFLVQHIASLDGINKADKVVENLKSFDTEEFVAKNYHKRSY